MKPLAQFAPRFSLFRRVRAASITNEAELRAYVFSVTTLCVCVALGADVANQLTFFVDWPTSLRSWTITTTIVLVLAAPISRVIAKAQLELYRTKMMFAALNATNEAIARASSREAMFAAVCGAVVRAGSFTSCLIALRGPDPTRLEVQAIAGTAAAVNPPTRLPIGRGYAEGQGLSDIAMRTREACVTNDYVADDRCRGQVEEARARGVRSCAALPLTRGGAAVGVMLFGSIERNAFPPDIVPLVRRLADSVAFALESFERAELKARAEARIGHLATHDALTDLPNRAELSRLLHGAIATAAERRRKLAVLFIDIDRFKTINDSLGHDAGDALLIETANRLRRRIGAGGFVGRIGGDEFVAILEDVESRGDIEASARAILAAIGEPLSLGGVECRATASIGVAVYPEDGDDEASLVKEADQAMYLAKDGGKNDVRFHVARASPRPFDTLQLESRLRRALERGEFTLHYQPKVDATTLAVTGLEALLRWTSPGRGSIPPAQFIPLAEESGLIVPIGRWALREACAQHAAWRRRGLAPPPIAVNISPRQFLDPGLIGDIDAALADSGASGTSLQLEITESMVMRGVEHAVAALGEIRRRGIGVAIDDFGTGYSSMSLMKTFPIDTLKIDRSFVQDLPDDAEDRAIVKAIIRMGKALGLRLVAEGVETTGQGDFLRNNGCDELQGFLFSRPLAAEFVPAFLEAERRPEPPKGRLRPAPWPVEGLRETA
jgi:diguanylate cyclase (GGDEF)-like protein